MISSLNKEAVSSKKNLFVKEFNLEEANMLIDCQINQNKDQNAPLSNRKIVMTTEDLDASEESQEQPAPVTPEQKLRRYLSLKLSADFQDLLTMSASSSL